MPPLNDNIANAITITGTSGHIAGTLVGATLESGESIPDTSAIGSVWYRYTPPADGIIMPWLDTSDPNAQVRVYRYADDAPSNTYPYLYSYNEGFPGNGLVNGTLPVSDDRIAAAAAQQTYLKGGVPHYLQVSSRGPLTSFTLWWKTLNLPSIDYVPEGNIAGDAQLFYFLQTIGAQSGVDGAVSRPVILAWSEQTGLIQYNTLGWQTTSGTGSGENEDKTDPTSRVFMAGGNRSVIAGVSRPEGPVGGPYLLPVDKDAYYSFSSFNSSATEVRALEAFSNTTFRCLTYSPKTNTWLALNAGASSTITELSSSFVTLGTYSIPSGFTSYTNVWDGPFLDAAGNLYLTNQASNGTMELLPWSKDSGTGPPICSTGGPWGTAALRPRDGSYGQFNGATGSRSFLGFRTATTVLWASYVPTSLSNSVAVTIQEVTTSADPRGMDVVVMQLNFSRLLPDTPVNVSYHCVRDSDPNFVWLMGNGQDVTTAMRVDLRTVTETFMFQVYDPYPYGSQNATEFTYMSLQSCIAAPVIGAVPRGTGQAGSPNSYVRNPGVRTTLVVH